MSRPGLSPAADLFGEGWSRVRGRRGSGGAGGSARSGGSSLLSGRGAQMVRAARGHSPAIFKAIRKGGCHTRAQLRTQIAYLTTKATHVVDSRGEFDRRGPLRPADVQALARRFADQWDPTRSPRLGHTSHLLMSFPIGTKAEHVRDVARGICERFFQGEEAQFDFLVAIHTDRAHPHAHVVLNRRSKDGEVFFLRRDHHFSYQAFREAMVEHGARCGLRLHAAERLDRGLLTRGPRSAEVQRAREEGRAPSDRSRIGHDLDRAVQHVAQAASAYCGLAAEASRAGFEDVAQALLDAGAILARGGHLLPQGSLYMADTQDSFDTLVRDFSQAVRAVEGRIAAATPAERPRIEQQLNAVLASVSHLNPLGRESGSLREAASAGGLYARSTVERTALDRLDEPQVRAAVDAALRGTGIASAEVVARLRIGAANAALEHQWLARDAQAYARANGLDLGRDRDVDRALDALDRVQAQVAAALGAAGVLQHAPEAPTLTARGDPLEAAVMRLRDAEADAPAFATPEEARAFRKEIERSLTPEQIERLGQGDETAALDLAEDRIDRLHLAKAYLETSEATARSVLHARLVDEIGDAQIDAQRLRHGSQGPVHG